MEDLRNGGDQQQPVFGLNLEEAGGGLVEEPGKEAREEAGVARGLLASQDPGNQAMLESFLPVLLSHSHGRDKEERLESSVGLDVEVFSLLKKSRGQEALQPILREELGRDGGEEEKEYEAHLLEPLHAGQ